MNSSVSLGRVALQPLRLVFEMPGSHRLTDGVDLSPSFPHCFLQSTTQSLYTVSLSHSEDGLAGDRCHFLSPGGPYPHHPLMRVETVKPSHLNPPDVMGHFVCLCTIAPAFVSEAVAAVAAAAVAALVAAAAALGPISNGAHFNQAISLRLPAGRD